MWEIRKGSKERSYHCALLLAGAVGALVQGGGAAEAGGGEAGGCWVDGGVGGGVVREEGGDVGVGEERKV